MTLYLLNIYYDPSATLYVLGPVEDKEKAIKNLTYGEILEGIEEVDSSKCILIESLDKDNPLKVWEDSECFLWKTLLRRHRENKRVRLSVPAGMLVDERARQVLDDYFEEYEIVNL